MKSNREIVDNLYSLAVNEEDARVCREISDDACREVPGNFFIIMVSLVLTKLGDLLISPKTVLAWVMGSIGVPDSLTSWLVPIRESGSLIPQLVIAAWVRQNTRRGKLWVAGSMLQGLCVAGIAYVVWQYRGTEAGFLILALLILLSLSRGLCSISIKDVQGKTIPKGKRGRLSGYAATFSGIATAAIGMWLLTVGKDNGTGFYLGLLITGAVLWGLSALIFSFIKEFDGETSGGGNALTEALSALTLLRTDRPFRNFVISRALLLGSALSSPFIVLLAQRTNADLRLLGAFLLASSLATSLSALIWGWLADRSSRQVMILGGSLAAVSCLTIGLGTLLVETSGFPIWLLPLAYFVLSIAHSGVRIGRKTYVVDMAGGNKRTDYVAVSNTVIGVLLLFTGGLSALISLISIQVVIIFLGVMGLLGAWQSYKLREV